MDQVVVPQVLTFVPLPNLNQPPPPPPDPNPSPTRVGSGAGQEVDSSKRELVKVGVATSGGGVVKVRVWFRGEWFKWSGEVARWQSGKRWGGGVMVNGFVLQFGGGGRGQRNCFAI